MSAHVILVCPCCASTVDAEAGPERQVFECLACGQTWEMVVERSRYAAHSLGG